MSAEQRIERLIQNMPLQIAEQLKQHFREYSEGKMSRKGMRKKFLSQIWQQTRMTIDTIDVLQQKKQRVLKKE
ncbi:MAG: hypothetical protein WC238_02155 [Parcubacteria group bacterium]|jgi:hypothetical protein